jgi:uncharacterized protein (TIGR03086 family)
MLPVARTSVTSFGRTVARPWETAAVADVLELFSRAVEEFGRRVRAIGDGQWADPTPCEGWDVRALVEHLVSEQRWAVPLLAGSTMEEVGDRFEGDLLGDDPRGAYEAAAGDVLAAMAEAGGDVLGRTVHVSFGDISGEEYVTQLVSDHVIHAWDLARGIGGDDRLDPELVEFVWGYLSPRADGWRAAGAFAAAVEVPPGADRQAQLLGLTGRRPTP